MHTNLVQKYVQVSNAINDELHTKAWLKANRPMHVNIAHVGVIVFVLVLAPAIFRGTNS